MKNNVLIFGTIAGVLVSTMLIHTAIECYNNVDFSGNMWLGYTVMLIAFIFIFVGIKSQRDKINGGLITFSQALKTGLLITLVASAFYVVVWLIAYYLFVPDFMDKYTAHMLKNARAEGLGEAAMAQKVLEMDKYKEMYKNPILVVAFTFLEVFPVGLLVSLVSALILKKKAS